MLALPGCAIALALLQANRLAERYLVPKLQFEVGLAACTDGRVLLFTAGVAVLAVGLFGLAPALGASRTSVVPRPASAGTAGVRRPAHPTPRVAGRDAARAVGGPAGGRDALRAEPGGGADDGSRVRCARSRAGLLQRRPAGVRRAARPGVLRTGARPGPGAAPASPPRGSPVRCRSIPTATAPAWYVGDVANSRDGTTRISTSVASDGFVAALGLRLEDGRDFTPGDSASAPLVMIASRSVATRLWPGRSPLGQQVRYGGKERKGRRVFGEAQGPVHAHPPRRHAEDRCHRRRRRRLSRFSHRVAERRGGVQAA